MTAALAPSRDAQDPAADLRGGRPVLLAGSGSGVVLIAASTAVASSVAWAVRYSTGLLRAVLLVERVGALRLPFMNGTDVSFAGPLQAVAVDARTGVTTGISAGDRARTLRVLADPAAQPEDLVAPGHVLVELAGTGRRRQTSAFTAAALRCCARAGLEPVAALADIVDEQGNPAGADGMRELAARHNLRLIPVADPGTDSVEM